jgi:hypothetical protein
MGHPVPALALLSVVLATLAPTSAETSRVPAWTIEALGRICEAYRGGGAPDLGRLAAMLNRPFVSSRFDHEADRAARSRFVDATGLEITVSAALAGTERQRIMIVGARPVEEDRHPIPFFTLSAGADCSPTSADVVLFDSAGRPDHIVRYSGARLEQTGNEQLNPEVPAGRDPGGIRVVHIDTGVAYTLPTIAMRLARDAQGAILGYDFKDADTRPFDRDPGQPTLFARQHGTGVASILLEEAPAASLIPFRYPSSDAAALARLPYEAAQRGAVVVMMPLGGYREELWRPFAQAVAQHPDMLFVVSAGSDGRNIDLDPVYPAAIAPANMLVVTSAEADGHLGRSSNWGMSMVDLAVPAERLPILSSLGTAAIGSGSSYAVPRIAAIAARLAEKSPKIRGEALKAAILKRAKPLPRSETRQVRSGWIADPLSVD